MMFDRDYRETVTLADSTCLRIRLIRSSDKRLLAEGFRRLSLTSRRYRFFLGKSQLSPAELAYLTEVDGINHFAIGAVSCSDAGDERTGVGVARFVRLAEEPEVAEIAITVIDDMQGKGIGGLLLERLLTAAGERGIRRVRCDLLASNVRMRKLITHHCRHVCVHGHGVVVTAEIPIENVVARTASAGRPELSSSRRRANRI